MTAREMADYVIRTVRGTADVLQSPDAKLGIRAPAVPFRVRAPTPKPSQEVTRLRLRIEGTSPVPLPPLRDASIVEDGPFDLLWRPRTGQTVSALGDVVAADGVTAELLPASIDRLRALARVQVLLAASPMEIRLERVRGGGDVSGDVHVVGAILRLVSDSIREPNMVLFNIAGDGTVQNLYPHPKRPSERPETPRDGRKTIEDIVVEPPFGTDRFVAIASDRSLGKLAEALRQMNGLRTPSAAMDEVERAITGGRFQAGLGAMFSRAR